MPGELLHIAQAAARLHHFFRRSGKPTVCLDVTYVVVYTYGSDDGRISTTPCAVIDAALGDRSRPHPACSRPPAEAGSARSVLAAGLRPVSTAGPGGSLRSRTPPPSATPPCGDANLPPGTYLVLVHSDFALASFETRFNAGTRFDDARQFSKSGLLEHPPAFIAWSEVSGSVQSAVP